MNEYFASVWDAIKEAKERGLKIVYNHPEVLQLDLDGRDRVALAQYWIKFFKGPVHRLRIIDELWLDSSTKNHMHVYLRLNEPMQSVDHQIAWQVALGSDPIREMSNLQRLNATERGKVFFLFESIKNYNQYKKFMRWAQTKPDETS